MNERATKALIWSYIKGRRLAVLAVGSGCLICAAVFWLYRLPAEAALYGWLLGAVPAVFLAGRDFCSYLRKCRDLERIASQKGNRMENLPEAGNQVERWYQEILADCYEEQKKLLKEEEERREEMTDYYTMWVHQVKTPISAMNLMLQTGAPLDGERLLNQLFKIEQYVDMVLQYLRTDSPGNDLVIRQVDLDAILRKAIHKYAPIFIRKKINLNYEPVDCRITTDEKWFQFVVEQLLSNALKYTDSGEITIRLAERENGGKMLAVGDTGTGIAPEDIPRVFEKGYTGNNGRLGRKSTGIGLYLCRKITARLSHEMEIESEPGKGTTVFIGIDAKVRRQE